MAEFERVAPHCPPGWIDRFMGPPHRRLKRTGPEPPPRLPIEIFKMIVEILSARKAQATLATLLCVKHLRQLAAPLLYGTIQIRTRSIARLLVGLPRATPKERRELLQRPPESTVNDFRWALGPYSSEDDCDVYEDSEISSFKDTIAKRVRARAAAQATKTISRRKLALFELTQDLVVADIPPTRYCADLLHICKQLPGGRRLMPNAMGLQLRLGVYDGFSDWRDRNLGTRHPLVRALEMMIAPFDLCIDHTEVLDAQAFLESRRQWIEDALSLDWGESDWYDLDDLLLDRWEKNLEIRRLHMLDDLPQWDFLPDSWHHNVDYRRLGFYPARGVHLFYRESDYEWNGVIETIATMLGERPPLISWQDWPDIQDPDGIVSILEAAFTVPPGPFKRDSQDAGWTLVTEEDVAQETVRDADWESRLSASIFVDRMGMESSVAMPPEEKEKVMSANFEDLDRRLSITQTRDAATCPCCGRK